MQGCLQKKMKGFYESVTFHFRWWHTPTSLPALILMCIPSGATPGTVATTCNSVQAIAPVVFPWFGLWMRPMIQIVNMHARVLAVESHAAQPLSQIQCAYIIVCCDSFWHLLASHTALRALLGYPLSCSLVIKSNIYDYAYYSLFMLFWFCWIFTPPLKNIKITIHRSQPCLFVLARFPSTGCRQATRWCPSTWWRGVPGRTQAIHV